MRYPSCTQPAGIRFRQCFLIPLKNIPCIHLVPDIIQTAVIPVGNNSLAHFLEFFQIVDDTASKIRFIMP